MTAVEARLVDLFHDSVLWSRSRSLSRSIAYTLIVLATALAGVRWAFFVDGTAMLENHTSLSLELAMARAYCGAPSTLSRSIRLPREIVDSPELRARPIRQLVIERAGSIEAYCQTVNWTFVNSENSLMAIEAALLRLRPSLSLSELGQILHVTRIACLMVFVLFLLDLGASLALAGATLLCGLMILQAMPDRAYSNYPFLFTLVLAAAAIHGFAVKYRWAFNAAGLWAYGIGTGFLSAFFVNMRTSYLPVVAAMFACVLVDAVRPRAAGWRASVQGVRGLALVISFGAGYYLFQAPLITRYLPVEGRYEASHPLAHPLVLALAVPGNEFSQKMGIKWEDDVGPAKAATIDPTAPYLSPRYNNALMGYYQGLWRSYPREMLDVYFLKFSTAGSDMLRVLRDSPGPAGSAVAVLLTPLSWLPGGVSLLVLYGIIAAAAFAVHYRSGAPAAFALCLLTLAACLVQVESGVIFSVFVKQYHNYAAFFAMFLSLLGVQALANGAWALIGSATGRARSTV